MAESLTRQPIKTFAANLPPEARFEVMVFQQRNLGPATPRNINQGLALNLLGNTPSSSTFIALLGNQALDAFATPSGTRATVTFQGKPWRLLIQAGHLPDVENHTKQHPALFVFALPLIE